MAKLIPEIAVSHIALSMAFYEQLGFKKGNEGVVDEKGVQWVSMVSGDSALWLLREDVDPFYRGDALRGDGIVFYLTVEDVDAMYQQAKLNGLRIVKEIETLWYGLREFTVADPDGYRWMLNMPVSRTPEKADEQPG